MKSSRRKRAGKDKPHRKCERSLKTVATPTVARETRKRFMSAPPNSCPSRPLCPEYHGLIYSSAGGKSIYLSIFSSRGCFDRRGVIFRRAKGAQKPHMI